LLGYASKVRAVDKVRTISENARTLKLETSGFEDS